MYGFCGGNPVNESDPSGFAGGVVIDRPVPNPVNPGEERGTEQLGKNIFRFLYRKAGQAALINPVTLSIALFLMSQNRVADDSTGPGSPYAIAEAEKRKRIPPETFITYIIKNHGNVVYVGKANGIGTPADVLAERLRGGRHDHYFPDQGDEAEIIAVQSNDAANRGAEDVWYEYYRLQGANLRNVDLPMSTHKSRLPKNRDRIQSYSEDLRRP